MLAICSILKQAQSRLPLHSLVSKLCCLPPPRAKGRKKSRTLQSIKLFTSYALLLPKCRVVFLFFTLICSNFRQFEHRWRPLAVQINEVLAYCKNITDIFNPRIQLFLDSLLIEAQMLWFLSDTQSMISARARAVCLNKAKQKRPRNVICKVCRKLGMPMTHN